MNAGKKVTVELNPRSMSLLLAETMLGTVCRLTAMTPSNLNFRRSITSHNSVHEHLRSIHFNRQTGVSCWNLLPHYIHFLVFQNAQLLTRPPLHRSNPPTNSTLSLNISSPITLSNKQTLPRPHQYKRRSMALSRPEQSQVRQNRHIAHRRWRDLVASGAHG